MITIRVNNIYSYLYDMPPQLDNLLDRFFAKRAENYWHSTKYKEKKWDGRIHFYRRDWHSFPTGLLERVIAFFQANNVAIHVLDKRTVIPHTQWQALELKGIILRDYQKQAIDDAITRGSGILAHSVNAGKTETACGIMQVLNVPTLWLTHRKTLMYQTQERIERRLNIALGRIGDNLKEEDEKVVIAIVNSLAKKENKELKSYLKRFQLLIVDECHHLGSALQTFYRIAMRCPARYRYGLSGTHFQDKEVKDWRLVAALGEVVSVVSNEELIDRGISAVPKIEMLTISTPSDLEGLNYEDAYRQGIVENEERNGQIIEETIEKNLSTLIMVRLLDHGRLLRQLFIDEGIEAEFISGEESTEVREKALKRFEEGRLRVLIGTVILKEGIDVENIRYLIIAGGGKSRIETIQRIGRGLRRKRGENVLYVTDFFDDINKYLRVHSIQRKKDYEREKFQVEVK